MQTGASLPNHIVFGFLIMLMSLVLCHSAHSFIELNMCVKYKGVREMCRGSNSVNVTFDLLL